MKKTDWIIVIAGLLIALAVFGGLQLNKSMTDTKEKRLAIYQDGELLQEVLLVEDGLYEFNSQYGNNVVEVTGEKAAIVEADCPTLSCINEGTIEHVNETVVCLPHRFHIIVKGYEEVEIDAISQ